MSDVSKQFDLYWNSLCAYPAAKFVGASSPDGASKTSGNVRVHARRPESVAYLDAVRETPLVRYLREHKLDFERVKARLVYDDPAKTIDTNAGTEILLFPELVRAMGPAEQSLDLVSPYFVPGEAGTAALATLASRV